MAISRQMIGDISVFSVASNNLIALVSNVVATVPADLVEGRGIAYKGENPQAVGQEVTIETGTMSDIDTVTRVANVDISAFTFGGTDFLTHLRGGNMAFQWPLEDIGGVANYWKYNMPVLPLGGGGEIRLNVPNSATANAVQAILGGVMNATVATAISNRNKVLSITINGIAVTLDTVIGAAKWSGEGQQQIVTIPVQVKNGDGGAMPDAPSGTTTLLEKAFNAATTVVAVAFTPKSANSVAFAGEFVINTFGFGFNARSLVVTDYLWKSHGVITPTSN